MSDAGNFLCRRKNYWVSSEFPGILRSFYVLRTQSILFAEMTFIWSWFDAFCYFSFITCETSSFTNWFVLETGLFNGLLFHMTQPTSRSIIKAIACSKPTISEHWRKWKHNGTIVDQCKQRGALCHIGLAKDRGGHLVNQPRLSFLTSVEKQQLDIK